MSGVQFVLVFARSRQPKQVSVVSFNSRPIHIRYYYTPARDMHGNGIPNGTGNLMGIPRLWEQNTELGMTLGENGKHLSGNGNYLHSHENLFPKVLC